jgi:hypothetical protein
VEGVSAVLLPSGSIVKLLGVPAWSEARFWDEPANRTPRADAWFWTCGCTAEPKSPGRFVVRGCDEHRESLVQRFERKARFARDLERLRP